METWEVRQKIRAKLRAVASELMPLKDELDNARLHQKDGGAMEYKTLYYLDAVEKVLKAIEEARAELKS